MPLQKKPTEIRHQFNKVRLFPEDLRAIANAMTTDNERPTIEVDEEWQTTNVEEVFTLESASVRTVDFRNMELRLSMWMSGYGAGIRSFATPPPPEAYAAATEVADVLKKRELKKIPLTGSPEPKAAAWVIIFWALLIVFQVVFANYAQPELSVPTYLVSLFGLTAAMALVFGYAASRWTPSDSIVLNRQRWEDRNFLNRHGVALSLAVGVIGIIVTIVIAVLD